MHVIFKDAENWAEEVQFGTIFNVILAFIKNILKFEFKFDLDAE